MVATTLDAKALSRIVARLRAAEPKLQAVLLCGSHARGEGDPYSDIDIMALTDGAPRKTDRAWFEMSAEGLMIHVSVGAEPLDDFREEETEPASWAMGFPVDDIMRLVWATPEGRRALGEDPSERLPPGAPELGDFVEFYMKVRRAEAAGDRLLLRWAARSLAEYAVRLLRPFNAEVSVRSPIEALRLGLTLSEAPPHYRRDAELCMGLSPATEPLIAEAAARLVTETLTFLRERLRGQIHPSDDIGAALLDGTLEAYVFSSRSPAT